MSEASCSSTWIAGSPFELDLDFPDFPEESKRKGGAAFARSVHGQTATASEIAWGVVLQNIVKLGESGLPVVIHGSRVPHSWGLLGHVFSQWWVS
jgi:hypothetical protein